MVSHKFQDMLFGLMYVITDVREHSETRFARVKWGVLILIEMMQVMRMITQQEFGWTRYSVDIVSNGDLIQVLENLAVLAIPRYIFFAFALIQVVGLLALAWYIAEQNLIVSVEKWYIVKVLRSMWTITVYVLFTATLNWVIMPIDCYLFSDKKSISNYLHVVPGETCNAFHMPEIILTVGSLIIALAFVYFVWTCTVLAFEINPLSRHPRDVHSASIERWYLCLKIFVTFFGYLAPYLTAVTPAVFYFLLAFWCLFKHINVMPFHHAEMNCFRGGCYAALGWQSFATIAVALVDLITSHNPPMDVMQPLQYVLIGLIPLAFVLGNTLVWLKMRSIRASINRLRGDWVASVDRADKQSGGDGSVSKENSRINQVKKSVYEKFFDTQWETRRRFTNEYRAVNVCRFLLNERRIENLEFLDFLMSRALEEHPESQTVNLLNLALLRFVSGNVHEAVVLERGMKLNIKQYTYENQYILSIIERKSVHSASSASKMHQPGQIGGASSVSMMEFESGMEKARKAHTKAISKMRDYWRHSRRVPPKTDPKQTAAVEEMLRILQEYEEHVKSARYEYDLLTEKFPQNISLLQAYAHFLDAVLNDYKAAETKRSQARLLEGGDDDDVETKPAEEEHKSKGKEENKDGEEGERSTANSELESYRVVVARYMGSNAEHVMGEEQHSMVVVHQYVQYALLLTLILATGAFVLTDFYLFSSVALRNIDQIGKTGAFRGEAFDTTFLLRSQLLSAYEGDLEAKFHERDLGIHALEEMRKTNLENYGNLPSQKVFDYYMIADKKVYAPIGTHWEEKLDSYWHLSNDFATRAGRALSTKVSEYTDPDWILADISAEKIQIAFVMENINRIIIPMFERLVDLYEDEVFAFGQLLQALVAFNTSINALVVLIISFFVMRNLWQTAQIMDANFANITFSMSIPRNVASKLYNYYDQLETDMRIMEDDEKQAQAAILNAADPPTKQDEGPEFELEMGEMMALGRSAADRSGADDKSPHLRKVHRTLGSPLPNGGAKGLRELASSTKGHGNALPLTLDNVNAWAAGPGSPKLGGSSPRSPTGRRLTSSIDTGEHRLTSQLVMVDDVEAQPLSPAEEVAHVLVYGAGAQDEDEGATAGGKFGRGRGRRGSREENVAGLLLDRAPSAGSKGSSSKGSKGSKRAYRKRREEQARRVAEEAAATGAVAQPKKSALRPVSHEGSVADDPRAARTLTPSESAKGGEGDDSEDEKKLHSTASLQSKVAMQQRRREKFATRSCNEEMLHFLRKLIISQQRWYNRTWVYLGALFIVLFVCTISMAFPSRQIPVLVNMAPTTNQGGRRRFLVVAVAHFTRELVLDDGYSRLTKQELSDGLRFYVDELNKADKATRVGNALHIDIGADFRGGEHNEVMYADGCPWRPDPANCSHATRPDAVKHGLQYLMGTYLAAVDTVLARYALPKSSDEEIYMAFQGEHDVEKIAKAGMFEDIRLKLDRVRLLTDDPDVSFIIQSVREGGDMRLGMQYVMDIFHHETEIILESVHQETRILFASYLTVLLVGFYLTVFRTTLRHALREADASRVFFQQMPAHVLEKKETEQIVGVVLQKRGRGLDGTDTDTGDGSGNDSDQNDHIPKMI